MPSMPARSARLDDDEQGPALASQWFLVNLAFEPDASSFSAATLIDLSARRGFVNAAARVLVPEITQLVICEKPA